MLVSVVSLWEIAVEVRIGKLAADIVRALEADRFALSPIGAPHLVALGGLPFHADHRDPFDHLRIAQAIVEEATFLSEDRHTSRYSMKSLSFSDGLPSS